MSFEKTAANKIANLEKSADRSRTQDNFDNVSSALSTFLSVHGLVGFWPFSSEDATLAYDMSPQGRNLTKNGGPSMSELSCGISYYPLNGSTQYMSRADEAALDITGALTFGAWCKSTSLAATQYVVSKSTAAGNQRAYYLMISTTGVPEVVITPDGVTPTTMTGTAGDVVTDVWYFLAARFIPSTELSVFINDTEYLNTTAIPAAIFNSNAGLIVGGANAAAAFAGSITFPFLCNKALQDSDIIRLFNSTRTLFGV